MDATGRGNCFPPVSYQGPCKTISVGNNADVTTKEMHSHRCRVKWPCVPQKAAKIDAKGQPMVRTAGVFMGRSAYNGLLVQFLQLVGIRYKCEVNYLLLLLQTSKVTRPEDFARICPSGWILAKRGAPDRPQYVCKAPENYTGNCYYEQNMEGLTPSERKTWGRLCEARWPEEPPPTICPGGQDWSHPCPRGWDWLQKGDMCVAPPGWRSSVENALLCPGAIPAFKDADTKRKFTEQCRLEGWSCLKPGGCPAASYHWVVPCPRGWLDFNGYCLPPKDVNLLEGVNKECRHPWFKPDIGNLQRTIAAFGKEKVARVKIPDVVTDKAKWVWSQLCGAEWSCNNPEDNELALGSMDNVNLVDL
eukprot:g10870.t1